MELEVSDKNRGNASSHVYTILKNNCSVCKKNKKKAYLMCRETCDYQICYGCMSIQLHKALSLSNYDTRYKLSPPLRSDEDRKFVEQSLKNGIIDAISSDHSPQNRDSKLLPFAQAKPGSLGLETLFSTTLSLVNSEKLPVEKAIYLITSGPAKVLNLNLGIIAKGRPADLTVIDPNKSWIVKGENMHSLSSNTCFEKMPMQGTILSCWKNGRKIF